MHEDDDEALRICHHCVGDKVLKREIRHDGVAGECSDCGKMHASWTIEQLAERIRPVFELHHQLTPTHPDEMEDSMLRHGMMNGWDRKGDPAAELLQLFAGVSEETATAVVEATDVWCNVRHPRHPAGCAPCACISRPSCLEMAGN